LARVIAPASSSRSARPKKSPRIRSFTGQYLGPALADERAHGKVRPDRAHMDEMERENLAQLRDLAQSERAKVPIEA
jgi:hypothetical protein